MLIILILVAILAVFRFAASTGYLIVRLVSLARFILPIQARAMMAGRS